MQILQFRSQAKNSSSSSAELGLGATGAAGRTPCVAVRRSPRAHTPPGRSTQAIYKLLLALFSSASALALHAIIKLIKMQENNISYRVNGFAAPKRDAFRDAYFCQLQ